MSERKAKALFDYSPRSEIEIEIYAEEILIIIESDIGDGWSKGRNTRGEEGMFPSNYYELISSHETECSPVHNDSDKDSFGNDWSESKVTQNRQRMNSQISLCSYSSSIVSSGRVPSSFQNFLFGNKTVAADIEAEVEMLKKGSSEIYQWKQFGNCHTCKIESYKVDSNFNGIKTFVDYEITSSYSTTKVMHRYKHFDWLYTQLAEKYPCIVIPPLPAKKFENMKKEFIENRKLLLQHWLNHIIEHPVLSNSNAIKLFFFESDKKKWQIGKPKIKNDVFKNGGFYNVVKAPTDFLDIPNTFERLNKMTLFIDEFYRNSNNLKEGFSRFHRNQKKSIQIEYAKIGENILGLTESLSLNPDQNDQNLIQGLNKISSTYQEIGSLFTSQAKVDSSFLKHNFAEINGITKEIPSILKLSKCALNIFNSCNQRSSESKLDEKTIKNVDKRVQIVIRTVDAELNWLQNRREQQVRSIMSQHLKNQIELFTEIILILTDTLKGLEV